MCFEVLNWKVVGKKKKETNTAASLHSSQVTSVMEAEWFCRASNRQDLRAGLIDFYTLSSIPEMLSD